LCIQTTTFNVIAIGVAILYTCTMNHTSLRPL